MDEILAQLNFFPPQPYEEQTQLSAFSYSQKELWSVPCTESLQIKNAATQGKVISAWHLWQNSSSFFTLRTSMGPHQFKMTYFLISISKITKHLRLMINSHYQYWLDQKAKLGIYTNCMVRLSIGGVIFDLVQLKCKHTHIQAVQHMLSALVASQSCYLSDKGYLLTY